jgi:hypothetical protein
MTRDPESPKRNLNQGLMTNDLEARIGKPDTIRSRDTDSQARGHLASGLPLHDLASLDIRH